MSPPAGWRRYVRLWRRDPADEIDDELGFHLEMRTQEYLAAGLTRAALQPRQGQELTDQRVEPIAFRYVKPDHIFLDRNLFPGPRITSIAALQQRFTSPRQFQ